MPASDAPKRAAWGRRAECQHNGARTGPELGRGGGYVLGHSGAHGPEDWRGKWSPHCSTMCPAHARRGHRHRAVLCLAGGDAMIIIDAPHFNAAVVLDDNGVVVRAAPILKYMLGWTAARVVRYCFRKGWQFDER